MGTAEQVRWSGWGRWTLFAVAGLLVLLSTPMVLANSPAAGWNILLGLILFAAVATGNRHAPAFAFLLTPIFALRALTSALLAEDIAGGAVQAILALVTFAAAWALRRQLPAKWRQGRSSSPAGQLRYAAV